MQTVHSDHFPEIVLYHDIDVGETFMPVDANEGGWIFVAIQEVINADFPNRIFNAVCLNNGAMYSFLGTSKVVAVKGKFVVEKYNMLE